MPFASKMVEEKTLDPSRILIYGPAKTRKTWWSLKAAEAGFNVVLIDMDDGAHIVTQIDRSVLDRIRIIRAVDGFGNHNASRFMCKLLSGDSFYWGEAGQRIQPPVGNEYTSGDNYWYLDPDKFDKNTVLIIDSYTALVRSVEMAYELENGIEWSEATKQEWDGYGWAGRLLDNLIKRLKALPCHVIVIGHSTVYEKRSGKGKDQKVDWARTQLVSSSGPQAMRIGTAFSDIFFFKLQGDKTVISTAPAQDRDGGSRTIAPGQYKFTEFDFAKYIADSGYAPGNKDNNEIPGCEFIPTFEDLQVHSLKMKEARKKKLVTKSEDKKPEPKTVEVKPQAPAKISGLKFGGNK